MRIKDLTTRATKLLTGNAWFVVDNGTKVEKAAFSEVVKQSIEEYAGSTLAGSAQTVKSAINALNSRTAWVAFDNTDILTQIDALSQGAYNGYLSASNTGNSSMPPVANTSWYVRVNKNSNNFTTVILEATSNAGNIIFIKHKYDGAWDNEWTKCPTRTEMDALNSKIINSTNTQEVMEQILGYSTGTPCILRISGDASIAICDTAAQFVGIAAKVDTNIVDFMCGSLGGSKIVIARATKVSVGNYTISRKTIGIS